jgi:hypothetical protein
MFQFRIGSIPLRASMYSLYTATTIIVLSLAACGGGGGDAPSINTGLSTPTLTSDRGDDKKAKLSWEAVAGAQSYNLYKAPAPTTGTALDPCAGSTVAELTPVATVTGTTHLDTPTSTEGHCYRVEACADSAGKSCGFKSEAKHANVAQAAVPVVFIDNSVNTYSGQQTVIHGYARNVSGTVTYDWKTPAGTTLCAGTTKTTPDLCFVAPTVTVNTVLDFELSAFGNGSFAAKGKAAVNVQPSGNVVVTTQDTRIVQPGHTVSLSAQGAGGTSYQWTQTGPVDPTTGVAGAVPAGQQVTLVNGNTANPTFVVPAGAAGSQLHFTVTHTDIAGKKATASHSVAVVAPAPQSTGQPLQTAQSTLATPSPAPLPRLAPQLLSLLAAAPATAVSGSPVQLTMTAVHGDTSKPYTWSWVQKGGISVSSTLAGANTGLVKFTAPTVTAPQDVIFEVTVSDGTTTRVGQSVARVIPAPTTTAPAPGVAPQIKVNTPLLLANIPSPTQTTPNKVVRFSTPLKNVQVAQVSGYTCANLQVALRADGTGSDITCTAPRLPVATATLRFEVSGSTSAGVPTKEIQDVQLTEPTPVAAAQAPAMVTPPAPPAVPDPLHVTNCGQQQAQGGQADDVILGVCASGGSGSYTYQWAFTAAQPANAGATSSTIVLRDATTRNPKFTAPAVTATKVALGFTVKVTDANNPATSQTLNIAHTIYNVGGSANPGAVAQTVTVAPGQTVTLHLPAPFGGTPPYTYSGVTVTDASGGAVGGLTQVPGGDGSNWQFTPPTPAAGTTVTYTATYTTTDAVGNQQTDSTQVQVKAPPAVTGVAVTPGAPTPEPTPVGPVTALPAPPAALAASISAADPDAAAGSMSIHGNFANKAMPGNTIQYINWTLNCEAALPDRDATQPDIGTPVSPGTICPNTSERLLTASGDGSAVTLSKLPYVETPANTSGGGIAAKTMTVKVTVVETGTWPNGDPLVRLAKAERVITLRSVKKGSQCYTCGDFDADPKRECSRIEIVTRHEEGCPNSKPYCMNDIFQAAGQSPKLYKRCVNEADAKELWFMQSSDKVACFQYDSSTFRDDLVCHLACYGDHCNRNALPPQETLYAP